MSEHPLSLPHCLVDGQVDTDTLLQMLRALPTDRLPLHAACTQGGIVDSRSVQLGLLGLRQAGTRIEVRIDTWFDEIVGGCNCHDEPTASPVHAVLQVSIARSDGQGSIGLVSESDTGLD